MKVLTFSKQFPKGHPRAGDPTHFAERIMACLADKQPGWTMKDDFVQYDWYAYYNCTNIKYHTVREGSRWKPGDMASLRIWSDKPYRSKQIEFAQVEVKKVWPVEINMRQTSPVIIINDKLLTFDVGRILAQNDGLSLTDFINWFYIHPKKKEQTFTGQIISWSSEIEYGKPSLTEKTIG
jgi:hypothetical protein